MTLCNACHDALPCASQDIPYHSKFTQYVFQGAGRVPVLENIYFAQKQIEHINFLIKDLKSTRLALNSFIYTQN